MNSQTFGGSWTEDKLDKLKRYLTEYTKIFNRNPRAKYLKTIYVDAFAGSGMIEQKSKFKTQNDNLFPEFSDEETKKFIKGSTNIALEVTPPFDSYLFIDTKKINTTKLEKIKKENKDLSQRIEIVNEDANIYLSSWAKRIDWKKYRAVVFLDPYAMDVEWKLLEELAKTKAVDLWLLFPLGLAINRMLTKNQLPPENWSKILTNIFGTDSWKDHFYSKPKTLALFEEEDGQIKDADFESISNYFVDRLKTIFHKVAKNPLPLRNSKNVPIFLLCFASGNPKGSKTAIKIAEYILGK